MIRQVVVFSGFLLLLAAGLVANVNGQNEAEYIPLCGQCPTPSIHSKSGFRTAHAMAEGKVTPTDAKNWCANWQPDDKNCAKDQLAGEKGTVYRISANCPAGKLTSWDDKEYQYAGVWTDRDIGHGRPRFRLAKGGQIVPRDEASGGLALAAQWELLCPGAAPRLLTPVAATTVDACTGKPHCDSNKLFSAEVIQFNAGPVGGGRHHAVRMIVRFHNLTNQPIILAYVTGSSTMIDNLGNGYTWGRPGTHDMSVQGIGLLEGRKADPSFEVAPGESRNATFTTIRYNSGRQQIGTSFNYDFAIAPLEILPGNQIRTVTKYTLTFPKLGIGL